MDQRASASFRIVKDYPAIGLLLAIRFIYLFIRHFLLVLMVMDVLLGFLKRFS